MLRAVTSVFQRGRAGSPFNKLFLCRYTSNDVPQVPAQPRVLRQVELFSYAPPQRSIPSDQLQKQLDALNQNPSTPTSDFYFQRGNLKYNLGQWAEAHSDFTQAFPSHPLSTPPHPLSTPLHLNSTHLDEALAKQASCSIHLKKYEDALHDIAKIQTPHIQAWLMAQVAFLTEKLNDALLYYSKAIDSAPNAIYELYFNRGVVNTALRKHEEALQDFTKALDISPENAAAIRWRGEILAKLERYKEAIDDLTEALKHKNEGSSQVFQISYWLGMCHLNLQHPEQALQYFEVIAEEVPSAKYQQARAFVQLGRYKEALACLEGCTLLLEANAIDQGQYYFLKGQCLYNTNESTKALECLSKCEEINPNFKDTSYTFLMLRGDCQFVQGKYTTALNNFKKAFEMVPPQIALRIPQNQSVVDLHMRIARCYVSLKNLKATGSELDKISPQKPTKELCMQIGNLYLFIGQAGKAVEQYTRAIKLSDGKNYDEYIARGIAYMALGSAHERDSLQDFQQAQTLDSENAKDSTYYIGELYFHNKKYEQAKSHFLEALQILPQSNTEFTSLSHFYLGGCYWNLNEKEKAISSTTEAIKITKDSKFLLQRAQFYEQLGKCDEAIKDFTEVLSTNDDAEVYEQRSRCYFSKKKYENAAADISKALALKPNIHSDWYALRAKIYAQVDGYTQAIKDLDIAISLSPSNLQLYILRSSCFHLSNQFSNCTRDCQRALELWPSSTTPSLPSSPPPQLFITYGSALFNLGEYETSVTQYERALSASTSMSNELHAEILFGLGRSQLFSGRSEDAMKHFEKAVHLWPGTSEKLQILQDQLAQLQ